MYERFALLLKENNLTAYRVAKETNISQTTFSEWKNGRSNPKLDKMQLIADYFHVTLDWLMGNTDERQPIAQNKKDRSQANGYYTNDDVAEYAEQLRTNSDMRLLFDVAKDISKEDLTLVVNIIKDLKERDKR